MHRQRIVFRADGNNKIGLGHIMRCLSLAELLKKDFNCLFFVNNPDDEVKQLIESVCNIYSLYCINNMDELESLMSLLYNDDIFVIDGYEFDMEYQRKVKQLIYKLVVIDDKGDKFLHADVIINHGDISVLSNYKTLPGTKIFSGFSYLILRKEFLKAAIAKRQIDKVDTAFICMGGSDPFNITNKALKACLKCSFVKKIIVVTGSLYQYKGELLQIISLLNDKIIHHFENLNAAQMVHFIKQSHFAISTASSISLEICCVKAGLLSGTVIDNQVAIHKHLIDSGCCVSLGDFNKASERDIIDHLKILSNTELVNTIMKNQFKAIDGLSGDRILSEFKKLVA